MCTFVVERLLGEALDHAVGVVADHPGLHQREQHPLREQGAVGELEVLAHPLGVDDHALDQRQHAALHVVEQDRRVGQDDPLDRRVRDVALVPERDVLERRQRVPAEHPREADDLLGLDRVALVRHRARALLAAAERLAHLADLGPGEVAKLGREPLHARRPRARSPASSSAWRSRGTTWVETGSRARPSRASTRSSNSGEVAEYVPTAPESAPTATWAKARSSRSAFR